MQLLMNSVPRFPASGKAAKKRLSCVRLVGVTVSVFIAALLNFPTAGQAQTAEKKPNILVIMGDDVGWFNIGA
jgi:arylsulfatase